MRQPAKRLSLYLHVPFCALKCRYCDFNSYAGMEELVRPFVEALLAEVRLWGAVAGQDWSVETVYFGGGTPSLLPLEELARIMSAVRDSFKVVRGAEVSLEANPGTVSKAYLRGLLEAGVNRLSLGVQSFHDDELESLDRLHTAEEARQAFRDAREAGFDSVNLDLIYGLPGQPFERWRTSLEEAIGLAPDHLSLYALTVEEGTRLAYDVAHGSTPPPDPDMQAAMYEWSLDRLAAAGYQQYEISNWARPGHECRHNLVYWRNGWWLGLGPGAHSHWAAHPEEEDYRFANVYSPRAYVRSAGAPRGDGVDRAGGTAGLLNAMRQVSWTEAQSREVAMADTAILALRLNEGLDSGEFRRRFGVGPWDVFAEGLAEAESAGLLEVDGDRLRLTRKGRLLANEVFVRLLPSDNMAKPA